MNPDILRSYNPAGVAVAAKPAPEPEPTEQDSELKFVRNRYPGYRVVEIGKSKYRLTAYAGWGVGSLVCTNKVSSTFVIKLNYGDANTVASIDRLPDRSAESGAVLARF